jgi:ribosome-binding protein aMBF1 (putative translation factor)
MRPKQSVTPSEWFERKLAASKDTPEYELEWLLLDIEEALHTSMEAQGITRSELADRLGTSRAFITKLLGGQENLTLKTLVRVANALEMKVDAKFVPRERAAKVAKKPRVKRASGAKIRGVVAAATGSPTKRATKRVAVAARSKR